MTYRDHMRAVAEHTAPTPQMEAEVRRRLSQGRRRSWAPLAGAALALAAGLALFLAWDRDPPEPVTVVLSEDTTALGAVQIRAVGLGTAEGLDKHWDIDWTQGELAVEVPPDGEHQVVVRTPEAAITVVGTAFDVERTALGTEVRVERGKVEVACVEGPTDHLSADGAHTCLPATPAGMLGRARALTDDTEIVDAIDRGRSLGEADPGVVAELSVVRLDALVRLGRSDEALREAEAYLELPEPARAEQVRHVAVALALQVGGCERALPHLTALEHPTPDEEARLAACRQ